MWRNRWERHWGLPRGSSEAALYCHTKRPVFLRVMEDFRYIFTHQDNRALLREYIQRRVDQKLSLGIPYNWFLQLMPEDMMPELSDQLMDDIICCEERLMPLGRCVVAVGGPGQRYEDTGLLMFLGDCCRLYLYDPRTEVINMAAENSDELARFGVIGCELMYRQPTTPYATVVPEDVVQGLLARDGNVEELSAYVGEHHERDVNLHTPGRRAKTLKLVANCGCLHDYWPFEAVDPWRLAACQVAITVRLRCRWYLLGAVGSYRCGGVFMVSKLVIFDRFGRIYVVVIRNGNYRSPASWMHKIPGETHRLADNLQEFFKAGFIKMYFRRRHEHYLRRVARLERRPKCIHAPVITLPQRTFLQLGVGQDTERQYVWLCREGRFRPEMLTTWDAWDAFAVWQDRVSRGRPSVVPRPVNQAPAGRDDEDDEDEDEEDNPPAAAVRQGDRVRHDEESGDSESSDDEEEWEDLGFDVTEDIIYSAEEDRQIPHDPQTVEWWFEQKAVADGYMTEHNVTEADVEARRIAAMDQPIPHQFRQAFDLREFYE
ncbi:protein US23 [Aotine betaherpesvirus 1]|uniref:Protein US23 n=1 Tax=Aotine betaherpesvirus 1 TaxID=50290 RepID=G8XUK8_9BETA|nr:protein US23 [Aotine betaherpesvirus 1]AEV80850.1 protein US23 [Aotine betaherpesvirus 1]